MIRYISLTILFLIAFSGYSQTRYTEQSGQGKQIKLSENSSIDLTLAYPENSSVWTDLLVLTLKADNQALVSSGEAVADCRITLSDGQSFSVKLEIGRDQPEALWSIRLAVPAENVQVAVEDLYVGGELLSSNVLLTLTHESEFGYSNVKDVPLLSEAMEVINNEKRFALALQTVGGNGLTKAPYSYYQVELLRLFPRNEEGVFNLSWENASSYIVKGEFSEEATIISVPITAGQGYYAFRVRAVSEHEPNGLANKENYGPWLLPAEAPSVLGEELKAIFGYLYFSDADSEDNYIYSRIFSEAGKTKETVTYADKLLNSRQSLVYLPSENKVIRTQTVIDYSGRPVITTLPVPDAVEGRNLSYKEKVAKNDSGELFSAKDFDKETNPSLMNLGAYYSGNNAEGVAGDEGYGYSRTTFYNDGSGRVFEQSGVGQTHAIGQITTKTLYGTAVQSELDYLFGDEAPKAENVFKTYTIDPNNVVSVSYTTKEGQVIATGLSSLEGIDSQLEEINSGTEMALEDVMNGSVRIGNALASTKRIILPKDQNISIAYRLKQGSLDQLCGSINLDCSYSLAIEVFKILSPVEQLSEGSKEIVKQVYATSFLLDDSQGNVINEDGYLSTSLLIEDLSAGSYLISKKIIPGEVKASEVSNSRQQVEPLLSMIEGWLDVVQTPAQMEEFYAHLREFGVLFSSGRLADYQDDVFTTAALNAAFIDLYNADTESFKLTTFPEPKPNSEPEPVLVFNVSTTCCNNISVPIDWEPPFECPEVISSVADTPPFLDWAVKRLSTVIQAGEEGVDTDAEVKAFLIEHYMKGWNEKTFNLMVYHMLTDEYEGSALFVDETTQQPVAAVQYTCDQLFKCWSGAVASLKQKYDANYVDESERNVSDNYDKRQDSEGAEQHDTFIDKKALMPKKGIFKKWRAKRRAKKVSKQVRNLRFPQTPTNSGEQEDIEHSLLKYFLDCAGFRFAKILTPFDAEPLPEDQSATFNYYAPAASSELVPYSLNEETESNFQALLLNQTDLPYLPLDSWVGPGETFEMVDESGNLYTEFKPFYPFIKNPIYAFKYFQYDGIGKAEYAQLENSTCFTDPNDCYVIAYNQIQGSMRVIDGMQRFEPEITTCCEGEGCIEYPNYPATGTTKTIVAEFCDYGQAVCGLYPSDWSSEQRLMFYNKLKSFEPEEFQEPNITIPTTTEYATYADPSARWYQLEVDSDKGELDDLAYEEGYPAIIDGATYDGLGQLAGGFTAANYYKPIILKDEEGNERTTFSFIAYLLTNVELDCNEGCESKRTEIRRKIFEELQEKCYDLDGCYQAPNGDVVLRKDIDLLVDEIIAQCQTQCVASTFSFTEEDCRLYSTPKYSTAKGSNITGDPAIEIGIAKPDFYNATDQDAYTSSYTEEGKAYYRFEKYAGKDANNQKIRYNLSLYEATLLNQVSDWELDIVFPCMCPDETACTEDLPLLVSDDTEPNTYVSPDTYIQKEGLPAIDQPAVASPAIEIITTVPTSRTN